MNHLSVSKWDHDREIGQTASPYVWILSQGCQSPDGFSVKCTLDLEVWMGLDHLLEHFFHPTHNVKKYHFKDNFSM